MGSEEDPMATSSDGNRDTAIRPAVTHRSQDFSRHKSALQKSRHLKEATYPFKPVHHKHRLDTPRMIGL